MSNPTPMHLAVLLEVHHARISSLSGLGELTRQKVIDLGMMEPPLVDTVGDALFITSQGEDALRANRYL